MNIKFLKMGLCIMTGYTNISCAQIIKTDRVQVIQDQTYIANKDTLILLDVDKVLIVLTDEALEVRLKPSLSDSLIRTD